MPTFGAERAGEWGVIFWRDWTTSRESQMRLFLALIAATAGISLSDWLFFGVIFHDEYMRTPEMWRAGPESRKIAGSMLLAVFGTAAFLVLAQHTGVHGFGPAMALSARMARSGAAPDGDEHTLLEVLREARRQSRAWMARAASDRSRCLRSHRRIGIRAGVHTLEL